VNNLSIPLKELTGDFEEKRFAIQKPDGTEGEIVVKALSVAELHETVMEAEKWMNKRKKVDDTSKDMYRNFCLVVKSVTSPPLTVDFLENKIDYKPYSQILAIVKQVNILSKK
jgi:hypothetical protein